MMNNSPCPILDLFKPCHGYSAVSSTSYDWVWSLRKQGFFSNKAVPNSRTLAFVFPAMLLANILEIEGDGIR
jgi:hypothetical protein